MQTVPTNSAEAIERFGVKSASLGTILPTVALPALGAFAGRRYMPNSDFGGMIGGIAGGVAGQEVKEMVERHQRAREQQLAMGVPMGAPYAIDPSMQDIPSWALQGASYLRPSLKLSTLLRTLEGKGA